MPRAQASAALCVALRSIDVRVPRPVRRPEERELALVVVPSAYVRVYF